jgi:hypothetical protein
MAPSALPHRRLDDLVLDVLAAQQLPKPAMARRPSDVSIEVIDATSGEDEIAVTTKFVKLSLPYEKVEIDLDPGPLTPVRTRRTTFVRTIRARETARDFAVPSLPHDSDAAATVTMPQFAAGTGPVPTPAGETKSFESVWYDKSEDSLSRMLAAEKERRARQWLWLAISIVVATAATLALAL